MCLPFCEVNLCYEGKDLCTAHRPRWGLCFTQMLSALLKWRARVVLAVINQLLYAGAGRFFPANYLINVNGTLNYFKLLLLVSRQGLALRCVDFFPWQEHGQRLGVKELKWEEGRALLCAAAGRERCALVWMYLNLHLFKMDISNWVLCSNIIRFCFPATEWNILFPRV